MAIPAGNRYVATRPVVLGIARLFILALCHLPLLSASPIFASPSRPFVALSEEPAKSPHDAGLWLYLGIAAALVLSGGAFAGLTIALMGQDEVYLQVIQTSGDGPERKNAASVLSLLKKGKHWVLVTLLLSNVITNETLPIVIDRSLGGGWPAILGSTVLIVIFGEIVPQSICVRYGLPIGAWMAPAVLALMYVTSPIAWPVAKLLDRLLGEDHGTIYKKAGLKTLVTLHKTLGEAGEQLNSDEVTIISAVLDLKEKAVGIIMTPMEDVFIMSADTVLDEHTMDIILSQGYSRIPIHAPDNPTNFIGMLLVKMLITYDPEDCKRVRDFALATLPETRPETSCLDIVNFFQEGKSHMVLVSEYPSEDRGALGVVTLEDVIEELIGEEIIDESDVFIDVHKAIRRMTPAPKSRVPKGKIVEGPPVLNEPPQGELVDIDGESQPPKEAPKASVTPSRRRSSVEAPPPRFQLRRQTTGKDSEAQTGWVTQRGTTDEIREHLKHLGPSNLASRPRHTRYQNVKIKRGNSSPTRLSQPDFISTQATTSDGSSQTAVGLPGGIGAGVLHSAGMDARDGVHAVKLGYGTMAPTSTFDLYKDAPPVSVPEPVREEQDDPSRCQLSGPASPATSVHSGSSKSAERPKPGNYKHPGPARSGSITEQVIDVNGIRKVVLHTTSSSEGDEGQRSSPPSRGEPPIQDSSKTNAAAGDAGDSNKASDVGESGGAAGAKRKRRRKKRAGQGAKGSENHPNEQQPLLPRH